MIGAPSATVLALIAGTALAWQVSTVAVLVDVAAGWVRRQLALRRVRKRWARFRSQHPEEF